MNDIWNKAYEAHIAASILALGIQNINRLSQSAADRVHDYALDSLYKAGIDIDLAEVKRINELPLQEAQSLVIRLKSNIVAKLQGSSNLLAAQLFELSFNIYLLSTTPEEIPNLTQYLTGQASQVGFKDGVFPKVLKLLESNVDEGLLAYQGAVDQLLDRVEMGSWLDLVELKLEIPWGPSLDLEKALDRYKKWREGKTKND